MLTLNKVILLLGLGGMVNVRHEDCFSLLALRDLSCQPSKVLHKELSRLRDKYKRLFADHLAIFIQVDDCSDSAHRELHKLAYIAIVRTLKVHFDL